MLLKSESTFFDNFYRKYPYPFSSNQILKKMGVFYRDQVLKEVGKLVSLKKSRILSMGCGSGEFELFLAPYCKEIVAFDASEEAISLATKINHRRNVKFLVASAPNLPFKDKEFDVVLSLSTIHHIPNKKKLLQEICRVLKNPGGVIYAKDPNKNSLLHRFGMTFFGKIYRSLHSPEESPLEPEEMEKMILDSGFKNCSIKYIDFFLGPVAFLFPGIPSSVAKLCYLINSVLIKIPVLKKLSCEFSLIAHY